MTYTWLLCKHSVPGPHLLPLGSFPSPTFLFLCPRMKAGKGQGGSVGGVCWVLPQWGSRFPPPALPTLPAQLPRWQQGMLVVGHPVEKVLLVLPTTHPCRALSHKGKHPSSFILHPPLLPSAAPPGKLRVGIVGLPPHAPGNV